MPLPEHRALPLDELRAVVAGQVAARIARWQVYAPGDCDPWPDRLTAVPYLVLPLAGELRLVLADGSERPLRVGEGAAFLAGSHATGTTPDDGRVLRVTLDRPHLYWAVGTVRRTPDPDFRRWDHSQRGVALVRDRRHLFDELLATALEPAPPGAAGWREDLAAAAWQSLRAWLAAEQAPIAGSRAEATWQLAADYLRQHLAAATTRADVAAALGLHPNYLSDLCRRCTGESFGEHLRAQRLERAALLLRETDLSVRRIAAAVGWSSDGYLERRFKQRYGTTPGRWRRGGDEHG